MFQDQLIENEFSLNNILLFAINFIIYDQQEHYKHL